jgi:hypothetical protein
MALPTPALVAVTDTNALASRACNAASSGQPENLFTGLAITGRSNAYVSAHVPDELVRRLPEVASHYPELGLDDAKRVLWNEVMPMVPVIDLAVGDYLHPRIRGLMRDDLETPRQVRGDPDDLGTAAVAEFLAPSVIVSADSVFMRLGMANMVATTWLPMTYGLLRAAGFEANLTEAAHLLEFAVRLVAAPIGAAVHAVRCHPITTLGIGSAVLFLMWRAGFLSRERFRSIGSVAGEIFAEGVNVIGGAVESYEQARGALRVIEPYGTPTIEELAARYLARVRRPVSLSDLAIALERGGPLVTVAELKTVTRRHPAFWMKADNSAMIGVGRLAGPRQLASKRYGIS